MWVVSNLELRQIQYFIEVAKREHMTEAAIHLHVAQSAVSRQIYNLEQELGVNLFIREKEKCKINANWEIVSRICRTPLPYSTMHSETLTEHLDPETGTIRIGFPSSLAAHTLPTAVSAFRERYPNVKFQLKQGAYYHLIDIVAKGEIDMAILRSRYQPVKVR